MSGGLASLAIIAVGFQLALQAPINNALGRHVGRLPASLVSFLVGTLILALLLLVTGGFSQVSELGAVPFAQLLGGLIGAAFVAISTLTIARIGAGAVVAATISGQLLSSLIIDNFGLVGVDTESLDVVRVAGALLLVSGTLLVVRNRKDTMARTRGDRRLDLAAVTAVFGVGLLMGIQHPLNALLSESTGTLLAALTNFVVGTLLLAVIVFATGRGSNLKMVTEARPWQLLGGLIGVIAVVAALSAVSVIGAAGLTAALVTGQLIGSIAIDRAGAFGLSVRRVTVRRAGGAALLVVGTAMCVI